MPIGMFVLFEKGYSKYGSELWNWTILLFLTVLWNFYKCDKSQQKVLWLSLFNKNWGFCNIWNRGYETSFPMIPVFWKLNCYFLKIRGKELCVFRNTFYIFYQLFLFNVSTCAWLTWSTCWCDWRNATNVVFTHPMHARDKCQCVDWWPQ